MENDFDFWTPEENRLVREKKIFTFSVNFGDYKHVGKYIYESDPMLEVILNLSKDVIHEGMGFRIDSLVTFCVNKQFVVLKQNNDYEISVIGECDELTETKNIVSCDYEKMRHVCIEEDYELCYAIVDLKHTKPYCFKTTPSRTANEKPAKFYRCEKLQMFLGNV